ncbi:probable phosphoglycerate mutase [Actinacidiphila yanglinensis]|uniref:Probable phosphoglycerate mutase n=1 Tax=Actinacidiphila yanglinensis TaxID=310779 RepID=A0A1H5SLW7_9ACTN|nr:histidine phosphatase family protein [Actinacidiphila yanglinensis]SEF51440.1 probable phosphoglycerate mutase [Actinacidiphila yanglinensis]
MGPESDVPESGVPESAGAGSAGSKPAGVGSAAPDLGAPTTFVLLRHGETALTGQQRFSGSGGSDPDLSERGRAQAELAAGELAGPHACEADGVRAVHTVVSSPLARCRQTAAPVAARLGLDITVEEGLRETDFGAWDGLTFAEARQRDPDAMAAWLGDPSHAPPGGESFEHVAARVEAARDALLAAHRGRTLLLVSHVTPIKTLVRLALGAPSEALYRMYLAPAALCAIAYYADGNTSVRYVNATAHLRGLGPA